MLETEKLDKMFHLLEEMTQSTISDQKQAPWLLITMWVLLWCCWIGSHWIRLRTAQSAVYEAYD